MSKSKLFIPVVSVTETIPEDVAEILIGRRSQEFKPFPLEELPQLLANFAGTASNALVCDPSYFVPALLALSSALVGNSRLIRLKEGWEEPAVVWALLVAGSGTLKSPAQDSALAPILAMQQEAFYQHEQRFAAYEVDLANWESCKRNSKGARLDDAKPKEPICNRLYCGDTTVEALAVLLERQPRGLLLYRDELTAWFKSFDKFTNAKGADVAQWLEMNRAKQLIVDRKTAQRPTIFVPRAFLSITGGIQPGVLQEILTPSFVENGMAARFLFARPPIAKKVWSDDSLDPEFQSQFQSKIQKLQGLEMRADDKGILQPQVLTLSPAAKKIWVEFYNNHAEEQRNLSGGLVAAWSKLEAYTARFAMLHHLVNYVTGVDFTTSPFVVQAPSMEAALRQTAWFGHEAGRLYSGMDASEASKLEGKSLNLIGRKGGVVTANELRRSSRSIKTSADAKDLLDQFVSRGLGKWIPKPSTPQGGAPTTEFHLHPELLRNEAGNPGGLVDDTSCANPLNKEIQE